MILFFINFTRKDHRRLVFTKTLLFNLLIEPYFFAALSDGIFLLIVWRLLENSQILRW